MEKMLSVRGKKLIVIDKYTFRKDKETEFGVSYRCTVKTCTASISVDRTEEVLLQLKGHHNHPCVENLQIKKLQNGVKRKASEDISLRPSKIINDGISAASNVLSNLTIQNIDNIRKSVYRSRRSVLPSLPRSLQDIHSALDSYECLTSKGEHFLLVNNSSLQIILFSCHSNLNYLCSRSKIYVDGTFNFCPKYFMQLFTVHTVENGHYIPLVFILLPNKASETYTNAFELLRNYCNKINLCFNPKEIVCDFEKSIHISIKKVWPQISIIGCRFHLTQAWFRKIQSLGLVSEYKNKDSQIGQWLTWSFGLLFLDSNDVGTCFAEDLYSVIPQNENVIKYADYLVDNYISNDAVFPPSIWASCTSSTERTTNACESFHSKFNANFYVAHPDIFRFISVLKGIQLNTTIKINSVHLPVYCKNISYRKHHSYICNLICLYKSNSITRFNFIKSVCHQYYKK